jgi:hypothetical protein
VDISKKRRIIKNLKDKGKKSFLLFLPCLIAAFFVRIFYGIALRLAMILPERKTTEGKKGIAAKKPSAKPATPSVTPSAKPATPPAKPFVKPATPSEISITPPYITPEKKTEKVKARPAYARLISAMLSVCFVFTFLPVVAVNVSAAAEVGSLFDVNGDLDGNGVLDDSNYTTYLSLLSASQGFPSNTAEEYRTISSAYIQKETVVVDTADTGAGDGKLVIFFHKITPSDVPGKYTLPILTTTLTIYASDGTTVLRRIPVNYNPATGYANDPIIELEGAELDQATIIYRITNEYEYPVYRITKHQNRVMSEPDEEGNTTEISPEIPWGIDYMDEKYTVSERISNGEGSFNKSVFTKKQEDVSSITAVINYNNTTYPEGVATVEWSKANDAHGYILKKINRDTGREEGNPITIRRPYIDTDLDGVADSYGEIDLNDNGNIQYPPEGSAELYSVRDMSTVYDFEVIPYQGITPSAFNKNPQTDTSFFIYGSNARGDYGTVVSLMETPSAPTSVTTASPIEPKGYSVIWNKLPKITNAAEADPEATSPLAGYNIYRLPLTNIISASSGTLNVNSTHAQISAFLNSSAFLDNGMAMMKSTADTVFTVDNNTGTYDDISATSGTQYYYAITAFRTPVTTPYESKPLFLPTSTTPRPGLPENFEAKPNENRIYLKWDAVEVDDGDGDPSTISYADSYIIDVAVLDAVGNPTGVVGSREVTVNTPSDLRAFFTNGIMTSPVSINYFFTSGSNRVNITNGNSYLLTVRAVDEGVRGSSTSEEKVLVGGAPAQVDTENIVVSPSENTVTLDWAVVPGADYYTISYGIRNVSGTVDVWSAPQRVNTNKFVHGNLVNGQQYGYKIIACKEVATGSLADNSLITTTLSSEETPTIYGVAGSSIPAPVNPGFTQNGSRVELTWSKGTEVPGSPAVVGYYVNITGDDGTTQSIPITGERYTHNINKENVIYTYSVQAYAIVNRIETKSAALVFAEKGSIPPVTPPAKPSLNPAGRISAPIYTLNTETGKMTMTWQAPSNAAAADADVFYTVYRYPDGSTEPHEEVRTANNTVAIVDYPVEGIWWYYVEATDRNGNYTSVKSNEMFYELSDSTGRLSLGMITGDIVITPNYTTGRAAITWKAPIRAADPDSEVLYTVYAYQGDPASRAVVANKITPTETSFEIPPDGLWNFVIEAVDYNEKYDRAVSDPFPFTFKKPSGTDDGTDDNGNPVFIMKPRDFIATPGINNAKLDWTDVTGAEGYIVHASGPSGRHEYDVSEPGFDHINLQGGDIWSYYVVAYAASGTGVYKYSDPSDTQRVTILSAATSATTTAATTTTASTADTTSTLPAPLDFRVVTTDGMAELTWTEVEGAYSYTVHATSHSQDLTFNTSSGEFIHDRLLNGEVWTYTVTANRLGQNGATPAGRTSEPITVTIGMTLSQPQDLTATNGNRQIDVTWLEVEGAEGYIVYLYNNALIQFEPLAVTSEPIYIHTNLINGTRYTYMVAAYKYINNKQTLSPYSMSVVGVPTIGDPTDLDRIIEIKGALPYGMDHSELASAFANHGAYDDDVDIYISSGSEATNAVRNTLDGFADGIDSFIAYPFDIKVYYDESRVEAVPNPGFGVTFTLPLPDQLTKYRDYINVLHINDGGEMEILPSTLTEIDGAWTISFIGTSFSPYAFVIYKDEIIDASSGSFADLTAAGTNTTTLNFGGLLSFTAMFTKPTPTVRTTAKRRVYHVKARWGKPL